MKRLVALGLAALALAFAASHGTAENSTAAYAKACKAAVGPLPGFSCASGVPVPVTQNGATPPAYTPGMDCDRPALLDNGKGSDGQCVPYSRILNLSTATMQVSVMCRQKHIRAADSMEFDEIDVIAHDPASGATCWFQAKAEGGKAPVNGANVPSPTEAADNSFWETPEDVAGDGCGNCHDNDPFMYSPFVGQVWSHVPENPAGTYYHVDKGFGFADWPLKVFDLRDNTCTGCHRIGTVTTCNSLTLWMTGREVPDGANTTARTYPLSHAMPPDFGQSLSSWNVFHEQSVDKIRSCCEDPSQDFCTIKDIPRFPK